MSSILSLSTPFRRIVARIILTAGLIGPAIAILVTLPLTQLDNSLVLAQIGQIPGSKLLIAIMLLIAAVLVIAKKARDIGYTIGAIFYAIIALGTIYLVVKSHAFSPISFSLPVLIWAYAEAAITATRDRENKKPDQRG